MSSAGTGTCLTVPRLKMAIDTAQGWPFVYPMNHLFLTHAHIDHAGGVAYIVSQRGLMGLRDLKIYMLPELQKPIRKILNTWQELEGFDYSYEIVPVESGDRVKIDEYHYVQPFQTVHRVPSQGYALFQQKKKLKAEFHGKNSHQLADLRRQGVALEDVWYEPQFGYTGDTDIRFMDHCDPEILKTQSLFVDCTYWDDKKSIEHAMEWGHIHLDQLIERAGEFLGERLVLTHASRRYKKSDLEEILSRSIPLQFRSHFIHFP